MVLNICIRKYFLLTNCIKRVTEGNIYSLEQNSSKHKSKNNSPNWHPADHEILSVLTNRSMSKYCQLFSLVTSLVTNHGNNSPEIGYSINKYILVTH